MRVARAGLGRYCSRLASVQPVSRIQCNTADLCRQLEMKSSLEEGITPGPHFDKPTKRGEPGLIMVKPDRFVGLVKEQSMVLFSPALLWLYLCDVRRVLDAYGYEDGSTPLMYSAVFPTPIIGGLGEQDKLWEHTLYGMHEEVWLPYRDWLATVAVQNNNMNELQYVRYQWFDIYRQLTANGWGPPEKDPLRIWCFAVESTSGMYYFRQEGTAIPEFRNARHVAQSLLDMQAGLSESNKPYLYREQAEENRKEDDDNKNDS